MSGGKVRVRFLLRKRYPHPDGPRRRPGDEVQVEAALAQMWAERGVVEVLEEPGKADELASVELAAAEVRANPVTKLRSVLEGVTDPQVVTSAMRQDDRATAKPIYAERLSALREG